MTVARLKTKPTRHASLIPPKEGPFRLRVGNGEEEGFIKLDQPPPWPIDDGVVDAIYSAFQFHRLTREGRYAFMNEAYRVLKAGSQVIFVMPHWLSQRAITDPLAVWPPLAPGSFMVYSQKWREQEQMTDLPLNCDFGDVFGYGDARHPEFEASLVGRNDEFVMRAIDQAHHELDRFTDLHITMTRV